MIKREKSKIIMGEGKSTLLFVVIIFILIAPAFAVEKKRQESPMPYSIKEKRGVEDYDYRFTWERKDWDGTRSRKGAEIKYAASPDNYAQWAVFEFRLRKYDFEGDEKPTIIAQYHSIPDKNIGEKPRNPISSLIVKGGRLYYSYRSSEDAVTLGSPGHWIFTSEKVIDLGVPLFGEWNFIAIRQIINKEKFRGDVLVDVNGRIFHEKETPIGYNDKSDPFFKFGIYCPLNSNKKRKIVDFRGLKLFHAEVGDEAGVLKKMDKTYGK